MMTAPVPIQPTALRDKLAARGIDGAASEAQWEEYPVTRNDVEHSGWRYPLFNAKGQPYRVKDKAAYRWKNADSNATGGEKYLWLPGKPDGIRYYLLPDTLAAIRKHGGIVYIASGEPDVLAYRSAGIKNVICWFGERSIPDTLADDLAKMGVWLATYCPDRDTTGMKSAAAVQELLSESEIKLELRALPGEMGSKNDINWLWMDCGFREPEFHLRLGDLDAIDPSDLYLYSLDDAPNESKSNTTTQPRLTESDELPPRFIEAIVRHVEAQPGFRFWRKNGWSNNVHCPMHQGDDRPSAGFNRQSMSFKCFTCGEKSAKEYGAEFGIHLREYYDNAPGDHKASNGSKAPSLKVETALSSASNPPMIELPPLYISSREVAQQLIDELEGRRLPDTEPMAFPYTALHKFGGFAELMWPGKLVFISGVSGGGKTSFGECCYRKSVMEGDCGVWYGPEWHPVEMGLRELQRSGGLDMIHMSKLRAWKFDEARGVPPDLRRGIHTPETQRQQSVQKMRDMLNWAGEMFYMRPDERLSSVQAVMEAIEMIVTVERAAGKNVRMLFFDYLQRAPKSGQRGWDWGEVVVGAIKTLCERLNLFGFVFIQPTKSASRSTRDGDSLNESSGQGVSDQQANLYLTLTPGFNKATGKREPYVKVNIVKNSMGAPEGMTYLQTAMDRLTILDKEANVKTINLDAIAFGEDKDDWRPNL